MGHQLIINSRFATFGVRLNQVTIRPLERGSFVGSAMLERWLVSGDNEIEIVNLSLGAEPESWLQIAVQDPARATLARWEVDGPLGIAAHELRFTAEPRAPWSTPVVEGLSDADRAEIYGRLTKLKGLINSGDDASALEMLEGSIASEAAARAVSARIVEESWREFFVDVREDGGALDLPGAASCRIEPVCGGRCVVAEREDGRPALLEDSGSGWAGVIVGLGRVATGWEFTR